jgi:hypothetical protein
MNWMAELYGLRAMLSEKQGSLWLWDLEKLEEARGTEQSSFTDAVPSAILGHVI